MLVTGLGFTQPLPTSSNRFQKERTLEKNIYMSLNSKKFAIKFWKFLPNSENYKIEKKRKMQFK
jgi:hypothetical protein